MAALSVRPGIGSDATILEGTTDRTSWFYEFSMDPQSETIDQRGLGDTDNMAVEVGRATSVSAVIRGIEDAVDFFEEWADELNEEKTLHIRREGTGSGKPNVEIDLLCTGFTMGLVRNGEQTYNATFMPSSSPNYTRTTQ